MAATIDGDEMTVEVLIYEITRQNVVFKRNPDPTKCDAPTQNGATCSKKLVADVDGGCGGYCCDCFAAILQTENEYPCQGYLWSIFMNRYDTDAMNREKAAVHP